MDKIETTTQTAQIDPPPEAEPFTPPSFPVDSEEGYDYLEKHGYVVMSGVLNEEEIQKGRDLAWEFLEKLPNGNVKRGDYTTWDNIPDPYRSGIIAIDGAGQSPFLWYVRGVENVSKVYKKVWKTDKVATSFDGFGVHRPFEYNEKWKTKTGWYHVDQNGTTKPDKICIQGLINFYDSGPDDGGLIVVPDSIHIFKDIFKTRTAKSDFMAVSKNDETGIWKNECKANNLKPVKVCAKAGDFILWDSRTIHCNCPAKTSRIIPSDGSLLAPRRLVAYVCMIPTERLSSEVIAKRVEAYKQGITTTHWPEECESTGRQNTIVGYTPTELTELQRQLIPL